MRRKVSYEQRLPERRMHTVRGFCNRFEIGLKGIREVMTGHARLFTVPATGVFGLRIFLQPR